MKRLAIFSILMIVCVMESYSQVDTTKGIIFESGLSWQQILEKAKSENKYVFVDCYASWCGPCKIMDKSVYPDDSVGDFLNDRFISVRMQMDTTNKDDNNIRLWHGNAHVFEQKYKILTYPTFLFFSPDGEVVHRGMGGKDVKDFLSLAKAAVDPGKQYYNLMHKYLTGNMDDTLMRALINAEKSMEEDSLASEVIRNYIHHYLKVIPEAQLWTKKNILLVYENASFISANDKIFEMYFKARVRIDSVMSDAHFSAGFINYILYNDKIKPIVDNALIINCEPRWHQLEKEVGKEYNELYAKRNIVQGRVEYYKAKKQWENYITYFIQQQELDSIENLMPSWSSGLTLNNAACEVFDYSAKRSALKKALFWVDIALNMNVDTHSEAQYMDTKANLLYKLGRKLEGLKLEERSHTLAPQDKEITGNYEKMKNGLPTWSTE